MKYLVIALSILSLASCKGDTKHKVKGTWLGRSIKVKGNDQPIPQGAFVKFDDKNVTFGQSGQTEQPIPYRLKGDTIITNQAASGQPGEKRLIIVSNDGKNMQL